MKPTKYKSNKNRKRALHIKQGGQYIPSKGNYLTPPEQSQPTFGIAQYAQLALAAIASAFPRRRQQR